ncbi:hypothetical protein DPMN_013936 [Dreissena polymorpha]|uniref:Uncharacterized protein n=2 Tax=Dreissena polymorpha TaxID=45954 RepID=A0A9D4N8T7_DREPO|nr:hypothetical protein DPMN_013936 [Dreissena polymorpha]
MASNRQHSYPSYIKPPKTDGCKPPRRPPNLSTNQKVDLTPFQPIRTLGCPRWRYKPSKMATKALLLYYSHFAGRQDRHSC